MNKYENDDMPEAKPEKREQKVFMDYAIFQGKVRLVQDGAAPRIVERDDAIAQAKAEGKNLVQIAYNKNDFPHAICKIMDYGKFKYEKQKKEKAMRKAARAAEADIKEICFSIRIDDGDLNNKVAKIREVLSEKDKVKVCVKLAKREMNLLGMAKDLMHKILTQVEDIATLDSNPSFMGGIMSCVIKNKT